MAGARKVLIVDDDEHVGAVISKIAARHNASVEIANDGKEALIALRNSERFDAIILDLHMPGITGWDVFASIEKDPRMALVPIIIISGFPLSTEEMEKLAGRATAFVDKETFDILEFESLLDQLLENA
ncbi:MAG: response regulator [bacterium]